MRWHEGKRFATDLPHISLKKYDTKVHLQRQQLSSETLTSQCSQHLLAPGFLMIDDIKQKFGSGRADSNVVCCTE
jgi:hypothetical protein